MVSVASGQLHQNSPCCEVEEILATDNGQLTTDSRVDPFRSNIVEFQHVKEMYSM